MSRVCEICGKGPSFGHKVSHANNKAKRIWYPNLHRMRVLRNKYVLRMRVCTRCIRSGKIAKAV